MNRIKSYVVDYAETLVSLNETLPPSLVEVLPGLAPPEPLHRRSKAEGPHSLTGAFQSNGNNIASFGGFDGGCEVAFQGEWQDWESLSSKLEAAKKEALAIADSSSDPFYLQLGKVLWVVSPKSSSGRIRYRYILQSGGVTLLIHSNPKGDIYGVRARYGWEALESHSLQEVHALLLRYLGSLGFTVSKEIVSRCDLQVTADIDPQVFFDSIRSGRLISRLRDYNWHESNRITETFTSGHNIQVCIYDKSAELCKKSKNKADSVYSKLVPQGYSGGRLTRVEYRLHRDALARFGLDTVAEIYDHLADLVIYLTGDWFRLLAVDPIRGKENKQAVLPAWQIIQEAFLKAFSSDRKGPFTPKPKKQKPVEELIKQGLGCFVAACARTIDQIVKTERALAQLIFDELKPLLTPALQKYVNRKSEHIIRHLPPPLIGD